MATVLTSALSHSLPLVESASCFEMNECDYLRTICILQMPSETGEDSLFLKHKILQVNISLGLECFNNFKAIPAPN